MTEAKHTPGPWRLIKGGENVVGKVGMFVAHLKLGQSSSVTPEFEANARLIAAAPDLLEALEGACLRLHNAGMLGDSDDSVRVAIEKAGGKWLTSQQPSEG